MLDQLRARLTYANVMSTIAVFGVLAGGSAWALSRGEVKTRNLAKSAVKTKKLANKAVTRAKLANGAVNSKKVADNSLTGADILASSLGEVPSAAKAAEATKVGGVEVRRFNYASGATATGTPLFTVGGLTFTASCPAGQNTVNANTGVNGAFVGSYAINVFGAGAIQNNDDDVVFNTNESFPIVAPPNVVNQLGHTSYYNTSGNVQVLWTADNGQDGFACHFRGVAMAG